ncbi:Fic family protein [Candidatus Woesearchaeota archaeon]|nr:Fic family protein [Candidatus Woesearchaeota archaeon]
MLSKKDLITFNKEFHEGKIVNESSLDFALDQAKRSKDWLKAMAYLVRAVAVDHVFEDGNKRTSALIILAISEMQGMEMDKRKVDEIVVTLAKKSMKDITKIERLIKNAFR